jgi:hypothetical protein
VTVLLAADLLSTGPGRDVLVGVVAGTGAYCLARVLRPAWQGAQPRALDLLHVAMAAGMVAMLVLDLPALALVVLLGGYAAAALWCVAQLFLPLARAAYARLAVASAAMSAMFAAMWGMPAAAEAAGSASSAGMHGMAGMDGTEGMDMGSMHHPGADGSMASGGMDHHLGGVVWVDVVVLLALALAAVVALARSRSGRHCRIGLGCEATMALAMAAMFVQMA